MSLWLAAGGFLLASVSLSVSAAALSLARRSLILTLLMQRGEMTGLQLKAHGVGALVYNSLYRLELEGLVESREMPDESGLRGGLPRRLYRLRAAP